MAYRLFCLQSHYRRNLVFSWENLDNAVAAYDKLIANGQVATQYVNANGEPTMDIAYNPNGAVCAIEGIFSPDGRVFGKMGHAERYVRGLYNNVPGDYDIGMFRSAVKYFK